MLVFEERRKPEYPEKNLSEQEQEPTTNSTHIWRRVRESNPGYTGGRQVLSPLHHPCSPVRKPTFPCCRVITVSYIYPKNWRARWKMGVSDDLRLKSKLLLFSWIFLLLFNCSYLAWKPAHRLVFMWGTLLRTYFLTSDLKFEELAYYFCLKLTQRKQQDRGF